MNHFNYGIIIGAIESAPLLGAYEMTAAVSANGHPLIYQHIPSALRTIGLRMNRLIQLFFCALVDFFLILIIGYPQLLQIPSVISSPHLGHFTHISLALLITYIHQHP